MTDTSRRSPRPLVVTALAVTLSAGVFAVAPVGTGPAEARSLFETLFPQAHERRRLRRLRQYEARERAVERARARQRAERKRARQRQRKAAARKRAAATPPRIESAKYYDYVPDSLTRLPVKRLTRALGKAGTASAAALATQEAALAQQVSEGHLTLDAMAMRVEALRSGMPLTLADGRRHLERLDLRAEKGVMAAVAAHYAKNPALMWIGADGRPNERARAVLDVLSRADEWGLDADDYALAGPRMLLARIALSQDGLSEEAVAFEIGLTAAATRYMKDARHGTVDPNRISGYHDFRANKPDHTAIVATLAGADDPAAALEAAHPRMAAFGRLRTEYLALRDAPPPPPDPLDALPRPKPGTFIKPGWTNGELAKIVDLIRVTAPLQVKEKHAETLSRDHSKGYYDKRVQSLVRDFQKAKGLYADAIIGKNTIAAMTGGAKAKPLDRTLALRAAMERLRWHPDRFGPTHVFINVAAQDATFFRNGVRNLSMRTVVGKPQHQTNFFHDQIEYVEFNPYWGVPQSILVNEKLPKLRRDPGYLDRIGYEIRDASGRQVSGYNIDWWSMGNKVPYSVRQLPGPKNALGELKIMFPNKHSIYMHDTPARHLFARDERAYSHGCVRLADPRAMAAAVLGKDQGFVDAKIADGENKATRLKRKIPVYVAYFTAWPDETGTIRYHADVYGRDKALQKAMDATRRVRAKARDA